MTTKTWFITGTSTGFGFELTQIALEKGDNVIATSRKTESLEPLLEKYPSQLKIITLDVTDKAQIVQAVDLALEWKPVDILVNNAGFGNVSAFEETPEELLRALFETNVFGLFNMTKAFLPHFRAQKSGLIMNLSSVAGIVSYPCLTPYCSTKHAVEGLSDGLASELAPLGVRVCLIEPGAFQTGFVGNLNHGLKMPEYAESTKEMRSFFENFDTVAQGDPVKAAMAMFEVGHSMNPPLRLPLGSDAVDEALEKIDSLRKQVLENEDLSRGTDL